jgi:Cu/Ag efflux protein CusF
MLSNTGGKTMSSAKHLITFCLLTAVAMIGMGQHAHGQGRERQSTEARGIIKSVDVAARTITLSTGGGRETPPTEKTYSLAKNVEVAIGIGMGRTPGVFKEAKLADLSAGLAVQLSLMADQKTVDSILAENPTVRGLLKAVDAKKRTLKVALAASQREPVGTEEHSYGLAADAEILVDDGRGRRFSFREGKLDELSEGAIVILRLTLDKKQIQSLLAEGANVAGTIKSVDANKKNITLVVRPARGDEAAEERTLPVSAEAVVVLDDGKGRRLSLKEGKLADVPIGALANVKLSVDQAFVMFLRVEGPMVGGQLKAVDAEKGTITISVPKGRGEEPEEKTYTFAKDGRVVIDGGESKLANLKVGEDAPLVQLRLSLNQQTVQTVVAAKRQQRE